VSKVGTSFVCSSCAAVGLISAMAVDYGTVCCQWDTAGKGR